MKRLIISFVLVISGIYSVFSQSLTTTYEYDELNRLVKVDYPNGQRVEYAYDALGNRISRTVTQLLAVQVNITPQGAGTVSGVGNYEPGTQVTLEATANEGHTFANWMQGEQVITTEPTYSFTITQSETFVANFTVNNYNITATTNPAEGGIVNGTGTYEYGTTVTLTALINEGYSFVNWTKDGAEVSDEQSYSFVVTEDADFMANFNYVYVTQESTLAQGWNWWSPSIETSIETIQTELGDVCVQVLAQNGTAIGDIVPGKMYKIQTNASCTLSLTGVPIVSATVDIARGTNWIGYIGLEKAVGEVFNTEFGPASGDKIISQDGGFAIFNGVEWQGTLTQLLPGHGYVYYNNSGTTKVLQMGQ